MTLQGHVKNGTIVFDPPVVLPEGATVQVEVVASPPRKTLAERLKNVVGIASDLPSDMADQHDHYLHGSPKE